MTLQAGHPRFFLRFDPQPHEETPPQGLALIHIMPFQKEFGSVEAISGFEYVPTALISSGTVAPPKLLSFLAREDSSEKVFLEI